MVFAGITLRISTRANGRPSTLTGSPLAARFPVLLAVSVRVTVWPTRGAGLEADASSCSNAPSATVTLSILAAKTPWITLRTLRSRRATRPTPTPAATLPTSTKSANSPLASGPKVAPLAISGSPASATPLPLRSQTSRRPCRSWSSSLRLAKRSTYWLVALPVLVSRCGRLAMPPAARRKALSLVKVSASSACTVMLRVFDCRLALKPRSVSK